MALSISERAEVQHAEQHTGTFVPTLDGCPVHTREEWEHWAREERSPEYVTVRSEFRLWNDQGTNRIYVRHDPCGTDSEPVRTLYDTEWFRNQHICPEEDVHA